MHWLHDEAGACCCFEQASPCPGDPARPPRCRAPNCRKLLLICSLPQHSHPFPAGGLPTTWLDKQKRVLKTVKHLDVSCQLANCRAGGELELRISALAPGGTHQPC